MAWILKLLEGLKIEGNLDLRRKFRSGKKESSKCLWSGYDLACTKLFFAEKITRSLVYYS